MLILDEESRAIAIDSIHVPTISTHYWVYDLKMMDYVLSPITLLEESRTPCMTIDINGLQFNLPCKWHVLIVDDETSAVDLIDVATLAGRDFSIMAFDHVKNRAHSVKCRVVNYVEDDVVTSPSVHRHQFLCHPIGPTTWINVSPNDMLVKYIRDREMVTGDMF